MKKQITHRWLLYVIGVLAFALSWGDISFATTNNADMPATATENVSVDETQDSTEVENDTTVEGVQDGSTDSGQKDGWNDQHNMYYVDGKPVVGVYNIDDKLYLFKNDGTQYKKKGLRQVEGNYYYLNKDYSLKTGVVNVKGKCYYFQKVNGIRYEKKGIRKVDGKYYCFASDYRLKSGWKRNAKGARYYFDKNTLAAKVGWKYVGQYKYYFKKNGQLMQDVRNQLTKKQKKDYLIRVNRTACCVTIYAKDGKKGYTIPVVAFICSTGGPTPTGTFSIKSRMRWHTLFGPCWGQWCEHIVDNILFHSVPYLRPNDNRSLDVKEYNKLGTMASHGCIRLKAGDAKWIYDNCKTGTKVIIYNNDKNPGPFDKPKLKKIKASHTWDPTDPNIK
ncbi:MAG: L,D-transpeptidase family protein [Lachnospiraceae bacterium]|nr:L,D-transpeptidase family protein [Lachnospiraceae bacterium]